MAQRRIQFNAGPALVDIVGVVRGNDIPFPVTIDHDITDSVFEAPIFSGRDELIGYITASKVSPMASGVVNCLIPSGLTFVLSDDNTWFFDETKDGLRRTLMFGDIEVLE